MNFSTLVRTGEAQGIGLHSGAEVRLRIVPSNEVGLVFVRTDVAGHPEIPVSPANITTTKHATTLAASGASIATTEHLLAALWCAGITHARIEVDGPEVPILDGSSGPWVALIKRSGIAVLSGTRPVYHLKQPVWIEEGESSVLGLPCEALRLSVAVRYDRSWLGAQCYDGIIDAATFATELAPARTFTLEEWIEPLRAADLIRGGSTDNAVVLHADAPSSPFLFDNEVARHKALDVLGDVALLFAPDGGALHAHLIAVRGGHGPHRAWMEAAIDSGALILQS